ncbi:TonB-dependent receptor [Flavobacterium sp. HXWNR29]|uniref:TonB-dependent receptor n=1 Tax=Flavobacterium odoriferum TaxID=2946604 RepID=UPI0021CAF1BB|nr:TonB-dependent receptor [Flavobacterium sp. HXWNR29]MCU4189740.1 TonB-dependent receptor [Flavobacterium sp. HXWNR29]
MKLKFILLLLFCSCSIFSQEEKIKIEFNDLTIQQCIQEIESKTNYFFYFKNEWISSNNKIKIAIESATIDEVLTSIFKETDINFLISGKKVILSKNNVIHNKVSSSFLNKENEINKNNEEVTPELFFAKNNVAENSEENKSLKIIGKESKEKKGTLYEINGLVSNKISGEPIANAVIRIPQKNIVITTDNNGFYKVKLPYGKYSVEIVSMGYKKTRHNIMVFNNGIVDFTINESITELNEIIVEAKSDKNIKNTTTGVTSFNMEEVKNVPMVLGERDILKVATTLPGIKTTGEGSSGVNVRGGKEDQNLFLLDNATIYNPTHFFGFFSSINPYVINNAEIYKASIPVEFGGRIASVFDIQTKKGNTEKITGEGGIGPVTSNITLSIPIVKNKSSLLVGGRATYSDWVLKLVDNEKIKNSGASFYDLFLKYNHKITQKTDIEAIAYYSDDKFNLSIDSTYNYSNRVLGFKIKHYFNENSNADLGITNSEYKFNIGYNGNNLNSFDFDYKVNETKLFFKGSYNLKKKHKISYGINSTLYNINPGTFQPNDENSILAYKSVNKEKGLENAVFLSNNFTLNDKLSLTAGLRFSNFLALGEGTQRQYNDNAPINDENVNNVIEYKNNETIKTYNGLEYRLALRYLLNETLSLKMSYDTNYQYLHKLSTNTTQSPTDTWKLSDLNIKPTFGQQATIGLYKNFKGTPYEVSLETYYKKSSNFLDYKTGAELILNDYIETEVIQGEGKAYGIEFLLKKTSGRLNGWLGYTYSRTLVKLDSQFPEEVVNNGKYFPANFDKPHDLSLILNYKFTKRYSISSNFIYQTGRPITYPIGSYEYGGAQYTLYSDRNQFRIPDYYRLDIGFNIEGNHKIKKLAHSFWNISIYNVLGRNNPYSIYFVTEDGKIKGYKTTIFSIPVPTITYNFKF